MTGLEKSEDVEGRRRTAVDEWLENLEDVEDGAQHLEDESHKRNRQSRHDTTRHDAQHLEDEKLNGTVQY